MFDDPLLAAVASAVAGRAVDGIAEGGKALIRRLRGRASADPAVAAAMAHSDPDGQELIAVRAFLRAAAQTDPAVAGQVTQLGRLLPPPRQLPPPTVRWVNRTGELHLLRQLRGEAGRRRVVVMLVGPAGVGKTALAVAAAADADDWAKDGHLYVDLRGTAADGPLPAPVAVARLLRSLGVPEQRLPTDVDELVTLWRSVTATRRLLILLDNAGSAQQVEPLLPATPNCLVYVTARTAMPGLVAAGAHLLRVGPLDEDAATILLRHIAGPHRLAGDPAAAARLVNACRGMPLAVTVAGAHLATDPAQPLRRLADTLTVAHPLTDGDTAMTSAFTAAWGGLSEPAHRLFGLMVAHPGPDFTVLAAAAGIDLPAAEAGAALAELVHAQLLNVDTDGRYRYPSAVDAYAREHGPGDRALQQARRRIMQWYLSGAIAAAEQVTGYQRYLPDFQAQQAMAVPPGFDDRHAAADWLEQERVNLGAAVADAATEGWYLLAYALAYAMWPLFHLRRLHYDRKAVDQIATHCARQLHNPLYLAAALTRQAWGCFDRGAYAQAEDLFTQARAVADEAGDSYERAGAQAGFADVAITLGRPVEAIGAGQAALADYRQLGDQRRMALAVVTLGLAQTAAGDVEAAVGLLANAVHLFAVLPAPDELNHARARILLGRALVRVGDLHTAAVELTAGLTATRALVWPRGQALALWGLGELARRQNRYPEAVDYLRQAEALFDESGDTEVADVRRLLQAIAAEGGEDRS